jgi:hypothetical protein
LRGWGGGVGGWRARAPPHQTAQRMRKAHYGHAMPLYNVDTSPAVRARL